MLFAVKEGGETEARIIVQEYRNHVWKFQESVASRYLKVKGGITTEMCYFFLIGDRRNMWEFLKELFIERIGVLACSTSSLRLGNCRNIQTFWFALYILSWVMLWEMVSQIWVSLQETALYFVHQCKAIIRWFL